MAVAVLGGPAISGDTETDGVSPASTITRTGRGNPEAPLAMLTTKTTGNSSPLEAWTVIRFTASIASSTAFDSSPAESASIWSAMRESVA